MIKEEDIEKVILQDEVLRRVWHDAQRHLNTAREPDLSMLLAEVSELADALVGRYEHEVDVELTQIPAICVNWLRRLRESETGEIRRRW